MIIIENITVLMAGIFCGTFSAIFAVLPALLSPGEEIPYLFIFVMVFLITFSGIFWTVLAGRMAMKGDIILALRKE